MKRICPFCQTDLKSYDIGTGASHNTTIVCYCCEYCAVYTYSRACLDVLAANDEVIYYSYIIFHDNKYYIISGENCPDYHYTALYLLKHDNDMTTKTELVRIKKYFELPGDNLIPFLRALLVKLSGYIIFT